MSWTRASLFLSIAGLLSCDAIYPTDSNPKNCVLNPGICDISIGEVCDLKAKVCKTAGTCSAIAQCESASAVQCKSGACVPCEADTQCRVWSTERMVSPAQNFCVKPTGASGGTCGQCGTSADCTADPAKSFCDTTTHICRGCLQHSECDTSPGDGSGVCYRPNDYPAAPANMLGRCAPTGAAGSIAYLGNSPAGCEMMGTNPSTVSKPYCTLAVAMASGKPYIKVLPSATPYPAIALTNQTVTLIGPGRDASPGATFPAVDLNGTGTLTLSDVVVQASAGTAAVLCRGNGNLNLVASNVSGSVAGIDANACATINIERTRISTPSRLAIQVGGASTTTYRIVNSLVVDSGSPGSPNPVRLNNMAMGVFAYNTVTRSAGSVQCLNMLDLRYSVFVNNGTAPVGCTVSSSVTDDAVQLNSDPEPKLQPSQAVTDKVIDKGDQPAAGEVQTDYFGTPRPKGKGWDKGYHELQ
jgi:hypothetical protein